METIAQQSQNVNKPEQVDKKKIKNTIAEEKNADTELTNEKEQPQKPESETENEKGVNTDEVERSSEVTPINNKRVDISVLKHKKSIRLMEAERKERRDKNKQQNKSKQSQRVKVIPAERFVRDFRQKYTQARRMRNLNQTSVPEKQVPEYPVCLAIRIRGKHGQTSSIAKILTKLNLLSIHSAVFLKMTPSIVFDLKLVQPFVTYGCPSYKTISDIVVKRGYTKTNGTRIALTDNTIIENALGEDNIVCIEDIIHQISTCGPAFDKVLQFLCPFKLAQPTGGFRKTKIPYERGGPSGNRRKDINQLLETMI
eukprot:TRINITY_DN334_c0_g1_i2.p1 TRINITY_DN334_c0_g1~~TRINITY_DN334_c0_g1_i2.p1  ORF type:complete len:312 (-),score=53.29 TRINITY_DN334_c0_g1_i2:158-1093(-)